MAYLKHLRLEKQWKRHWILHQQYHERNYGWKLLILPRITMTIKGFEEETKSNEH